MSITFLLSIPFRFEVSKAIFPVATLLSIVVDLAMKMLAQIEDTKLTAFTTNHAGLSPWEKS
jgi:hypothetical protein